MSWLYCTKQQVEDYSGIATTRLQDQWSTDVESIIDEIVGRQYGATTTYTEELDGDGTDMVLLNHHPVTAVTSVAVDDVTLTASEYEWYSAGYIKLVHTEDTQIQKSLGGDSSFPVGQKNITVVYTAGSAAVPGNVNFAAILMVTQVALIHERAGSEGSISLTLSSGGSAGEQDMSTAQMDISSRLRKIARNLIGQKWKVA